MSTLAPVSTLLMNVAVSLERDVIPHVAGRPFCATMDAVEVLRQISASVATEDVDPALPVPDYCNDPGCHNPAAGHAGLCLAHLLASLLARAVPGETWPWQVEP